MDTYQDTQKQLPKVFCKKDFLKYLAKFIGKHLWLRPCFSVNIAKFWRTPFLQTTSLRLFLSTVRYPAIIYMILVSVKLQTSVKNEAIFYPPSLKPMDRVSYIVTSSTFCYVYIMERNINRTTSISEKDRTRIVKTLLKVKFHGQTACHLLKRKVPYAFFSGNF